MNLSDLRISNVRITVDGSEYIVTFGTGERATAEGTACFAYDADDVNDLESASDYQAFCDAVSPVADRDLAIALAAREDWRLLEAGACNPVLSDAEYDLVRRAAKAMR